MATTLTGVGLGASCGWSFTNVLAYGNTYNQNSLKFQPTQFTSGTTAGAVDRLYVTRLTLAGSANSTITLTNYADGFGNTVSMLRFKSLWVQLVYASTGGATHINVGAATNPLVNWISVGTTTIQVRNGGLLFLCSPYDATGYPITASTADQLKITNGDASNTATVDVCIMGCSA